MPGESPHHCRRKNAVIGLAGWRIVVGLAGRSVYACVVSGGYPVRLSRLCGGRTAGRAGKDLFDVACERAVGLRRIVREAWRVDLVKRHGAGMRTQLVDLLRRKAPIFVKHGRSR